MTPAELSPLDAQAQSLSRTRLSCSTSSPGMGLSCQLRLDTQPWAVVPHLPSLQNALTLSSSGTVKNNNDNKARWGAYFLFKIVYTESSWKQAI